MEITLSPERTVLHPAQEADTFSIRPGWAARRKAFAPLLADFAERVTLNSAEEFRLREEHDITAYELVDLLLDENVERCPGCRWFTPSHDLFDNSADAADGHCSNCRIWP